MTLRIDINSLIPSPAQWALIGAFIIGALALIVDSGLVSATTVGYILLASGLITLALKIFTTNEKPIE